MFKLVVLSALVAIVAAKPGHIAAPLTYAAVAPAAVAVPAAVSHQSRTDVISKPIIATYAATAPVITKTVVAPAVYAAPAVHAIPAAVSHSSRVDVHSAPVAYAAAIPAVHSVHAVHAPIVHAASVHPW